MNVHCRMVVKKGRLMPRYSGDLPVDFFWSPSLAAKWCWIRFAQGKFHNRRSECDTWPLGEFRLQVLGLTWSWNERDESNELLAHSTSRSHLYTIQSDNSQQPPAAHDTMWHVCLSKFGPKTDRRLLAVLTEFVILKHRSAHHLSNATLHSRRLSPDQCASRLTILSPTCGLPGLPQ